MPGPSPAHTAEEVGGGTESSRVSCQRWPSAPLPPQPDEDSRLLPLLVCLRVLFVPLFMLCHVPERSRLPVLFPQDAYFITFMLLFAVSNGYLMSLTMCLAPRSGGQEGGPGGGLVGLPRGGPSCFRPAGPAGPAGPQLSLGLAGAPCQVRPYLLSRPGAGAGARQPQLGAFLPRGQMT